MALRYVTSPSNMFGSFKMLAYAFTGDVLLSTTPPYDGVTCTYTIIGNIVTLKIAKGIGLIYAATGGGPIYISGFPALIRPATPVVLPVMVYDGTTIFSGWLTKADVDKWFIANADGSWHIFAGNSSITATAFGPANNSANYANQNVSYSLD